MKTYQIKTLILTLMIVLTMGAGNILFAGSTERNDSEMNGEYTFVEDIMDFLLPEKPVDEILIYDQHEQLVIRGNADNLIIKNYISRSDLLTEVDHIQYYRMSYDEGIEYSYQFASK